MHVKPQTCAWTTMVKIVWLVQYYRAATILVGQSMHVCVYKPVLLEVLRVTKYFMRIYM
jgi:hypothetical protein